MFLKKISVYYVEFKGFFQQKNPLASRSLTLSPRRENLEPARLVAIFSCHFSTSSADPAFNSPFPHWIHVVSSFLVSWLMSQHPSFYSPDTFIPFIQDSTSDISQSQESRWQFLINTILNAIVVLHTRDNFSALKRGEKRDWKQCQWQEISLRPSRI